MTYIYNNTIFLDFWYVLVGDAWIKYKQIQQEKTYFQRWSEFFVCVYVLSEKVKQRWIYYFYLSFIRLAWHTYTFWVHNILSCVVDLQNNQDFNISRFFLVIFPFYFLASSTILLLAVPFPFQLLLLVLFLCRDMPFTLEALAWHILWDKSSCECVFIYLLLLCFDK